MELKAFMIINVPEDKELLQDYVEGTLDADVVSVELSSTSKGAVTALVTMKDHIDLKDAAKTLISNADDLVVQDITLQVLDPLYCDNMVIVENLDEDLLSTEFLKLYLESTFADGYEVVSDCHVIPQSNQTIVTFMDDKVTPLVLKTEKHIPLPSEDYHIQIKPFYKNFYSSSMEYVIYQSQSLESIALDGCPLLESIGGGNVWEEPKQLSPDRDVFTYDSMKKDDSLNDFDGEKLKNDNSASVVEEDTLKISQQKWKLLKDKLKTVPCELDYRKGDQILNIRSVEVANRKSDIIEIVRKINKSTVRLEKEIIEFISKDRVKFPIKDFCSEEKAMFEIDDDALIIYSLENSEKILETLQQRFLHTSVLKLPKDTPIAKIRECHNHCQNYLVTMSWDDNRAECTLTGLVEDVSLASEDIKGMLQECERVHKTFRIKGKDALFVKKHGMDELDNLFQNAKFTTNCKSDDEILLEWHCYRAQVKQFDEKLKLFIGSIKKIEIMLDAFSKEDLTLVRKNLKTDPDFIEHFQRNNRCCVIVEDNQDVELLGSSAPKKTERVEKERVKKAPSSPTKLKRTRFKRKRPSFGHKQKRVIMISSSCKLQIKPFGNIAREMTDLLVCGVHETLDLNKTMVSKAFMKMDANLQNEVRMYAFSQNGVCVQQKHLPRTKCKAIAFVSLTVFQPGVSDQRLTAAVLEVLDSANKLGLTSVSFPPLGSGRAFQFPVPVAAQTIINAVDSFMKTNSGKVGITLINLLGPDRYLFGELNKVADVVFKKKDSQDSDSTSDSSSDDDGDDDQDAKVQGATAFPSSSDDEEDVEERMEALDVDQAPRIVIVHSKGDKIESKFKEEVKGHWLFEDYVQSRHKSRWPPQFMNDVIKTAKVIGVWVNKTEDPVTKCLSIRVKGKRDDVFKMKSNIFPKLAKLESETDKMLFSPAAPKRGTVEFVKYAAGCPEQLPSYWKSKKKDLHDVSRKVVSNKVNIDPKTSTYKEIENLVKATWAQQLVGQGNDASGIPTNSTVRVTKIERLENPSLFLTYAAKRRTILKEVASRNQLCKDIARLTKSKGPAWTMQNLSSSMKKELVQEVNELYLFHGTQRGVLKSISQQGMDSRLSSQGAMFGQGVYLAESSTKSDQYADPRDQRVLGTNLTMILTRATLGDVFLCDENHESVANKSAQKLRRPPCTSCYKDRCTCVVPLFHSVMGDGKWLFREFVVYENAQCYPEYFITYQRIQPGVTA